MKGYRIMDMNGLSMCSSFVTEYLKLLRITNLRDENEDN
jgi:hypothetical protein